jgi:hypothetical protein
VCLCLSFSPHGPGLFSRAFSTNTDAINTIASSVTLQRRRMGLDDEEAETATRSPIYGQRGGGVPMTTRFLCAVLVPTIYQRTR